MTFTGTFGAFSGLFGRSRPLIEYWRPWGAIAGVALAAAGGLTFDAMTPQLISVGIFYVGLVLIGFWFSKPKAALALALLATVLIIVGYWISIPDNTPSWEAWLNRALSVATVWMTGLFVWHIRVLEQELERQAQIANTLSCEMNHRVGNQLQLVAAFLRLQAASRPSEESRHALELAGSRVMAIGNIQRMLSRATPSQTIDSQDFISALMNEVRSALPDPSKISITIHADSAELSSTRAVALGALLLECVNNVIKHAFPDGMNGALTVNFSVSNEQYILEFNDDGVGIQQAQMHGGFGTQNVTDLARFIGGSITCQPARDSTTRPGTVWRLTVPV